MIKRLAMVLAVATLGALALGVAPLAAQDPIEVSAHATFETVSQGGFQDVDCAIENLSGEPVLAIITADVTYADGRVQRFHLNQPPTMIGAGETFILSIGFAVPADAATGTATFECDVRVVGPAGGGFSDSATATFEVAAA